MQRHLLSAMRSRQQTNLHLLSLVSFLLTSSLLDAGQVRLVGPGSTRCSGRVEVYHTGSWGTVCDDHWDLTDVKVVCRQLSCGTALSATSSARFGEGIGKIWLDDVACLGSESSLLNCQHRGFGTHNCRHHEDAGVICSDEIRLVGPELTSCSGRVEIYHNGEWGTVCDDSWDLIDADVVCRQLSCGTALSATSSARFGEGNGKIWLDNLACSGNEISLLNCRHNGFGEHNCGHHEDTGVVCSGVVVRLTGFTLCSGRVEIYHNGEWGTVCPTNWDVTDAGVVCTQLSCGTALSATSSSVFGESYNKIWLVDVACSGSESSLLNCEHGGFGTHGCGHSYVASVVCSASLPKPGITMNPAGEVTWGQDVSITCTMSPELLGGTFILEMTSGSFRQTQTSDSNAVTFNIPEVDVDHSGSYRCRYEKSFSSQMFTSPFSDSVTIIVTVNFLKPSISMNPVGEVTWGRKIGIMCSISTPVLGGTFILMKTRSSFSKNQTSSTNSSTFWIHEADFEDEGLYQCQYHKRASSRYFSSPLSDPVRLSITVRLQRPNISLTPSKTGMVWGPEGAMVTRGSSFTFTCSINSSYTQGHFFLIFSGSNVTDAKPAVNNTASFNFPVAESEHQGNYSCMYELILSTRRFNSTEAAPITVVIKFPSLVLITLLSSGILLLLLLVLMEVCLVSRRRRKAKLPISQMAVGEGSAPNKYDDKEDDGEDDENVRLVDMTQKRGLEEKEEQSENYERPVGDDDHDSEEEGPDSNYIKAKKICVTVEDNGEEDNDDKETSDEHIDYIDVTPSCEETVKMYQHEDINQNC